MVAATDRVEPDGPADPVEAEAEAALAFFDGTNAVADSARMMAANIITALLLLIFMIGMYL